MRALALATLLAGCGPTAYGLGIGLGPGGVSVKPSVTTRVGNVTLGAGPGGAGVSTGVGPVSVGVGFEP